MEIIEINSSNYMNFQNLNVVGFSLVHAGAQGEAGGLKMVDAKGLLYHTNIIHNIKLKEAFTICPSLKDCHFNPFNSNVPNGWVSFYMGGGNFLVIQDKNEFKESLLKLTPNEQYWQWTNILQNLLK